MVVDLASRHWWFAGMERKGGKAVCKAVECVCKAVECVCKAVVCVCKAVECVCKAVECVCKARGRELERDGEKLHERLHQASSPTSATSPLQEHSSSRLETGKKHKWHIPSYHGR